MIQHAKLATAPRARRRSSGHLEGSHRQPIRILHAVSRMDRVGPETWLMHVLRRIDRRRFQMDFLVHVDAPGRFDAEIRSLGSSVVYAAALRQLWRYERAFRGVLRDAPPYDVFHSHLGQFSGLALRCADRAGIPVRIAHCHSDLVQNVGALRWSRRILAPRGRSLAVRHSTYGLACSTAAGESLFRERSSGPLWRVLPCGIDLSPFSPQPEREDARREFGIPDEATVVGHVGRFATPKNHRLIVEVAEALSRKSHNVHVVLVGEGPLRAGTEAEVNRRGLRKRVTFAGARDDVPRLFRSLFDVLLFPSLWEGLGLVVIETLAAGCPAVISDAIPSEADVVPSLITRLPLSASPESWADAVLRSASKPRSQKTRTAAFEAVSRSPFNIATSVRSLTELYLQLHETARSRAA